MPESMVFEKNIDLVIGNGIQHEEGEDFYKNEYIIPNYQRGYRWTQSEVTKLLDDIWVAKCNGTEKYCLQPIVVLKSKEEQETGFYFGEQRHFVKRSWKVVDGQQRLTTIYLILQFLSVIDQTADCYELSYDSRKSTNDKLSNWVQCVIAYNPRMGVFPELEFDLADNLDIFYMSKALGVIQNWFKEKSESGGEVKKEYNDYIRKKVFLLWYEFSSSDQNEITLFSRINMGKIPLTVSELLKAILLKKEDIRQEESSQTDDIRLIEERQKNYNQNLKLAEEQQFQRALEWDRMEHALSDESFFRFICSQKNNFETRMDYLFQLEYMINVESDTRVFADKDTVFKYYEKTISESNKIDRTEIVWKPLTMHFKLLQEWYKDRKAFHKIGFLIACSSKPAEMLCDIIKMYGQSASKGKFYNDELDMKIKRVLQERLKDRDSDPDFTLNDIDELSYENKTKVQTVLLLFNILTAMRSPDYRFSFEYVIPLEKGASIEHIFPQTPSIKQIVKSFDIASGDEQEALKVFVESVKKEFRLIGKTVPDKDPIDDMSLGQWWQKVISILGINSDEVQGIGNLALISKNLNTKLTNKMFFAKQEKIKSFDKNGDFIPICTHNVFLKYYSIGQEDNEGDGLCTSSVFWEKHDMKMHLQSIKSALKDYLPSMHSEEV